MNKESNYVTSLSTNEKEDVMYPSRINKLIPAYHKSQQTYVKLVTQKLKT